MKPTIAVAVVVVLRVPIDVLLLSFATVAETVALT